MVQELLAVLMLIALLVMRVHFLLVMDHVPVNLGSSQEVVISQAPRQLRHLLPAVAEAAAYVFLTMTAKQLMLAMFRLLAEHVPVEVAPAQDHVMVALALSVAQIMIARLPFHANQMPVVDHAHVGQAIDLEAAVAAMVLLALLVQQIVTVKQALPVIQQVD